MFDVTLKQQNSLDRIGEKYELKLVLLHGSYAKGLQKEGSDFDVAVLERKHLNSKLFLSLRSELAEVLGDTITRELDLKTLYHADPLFVYYVARDSVLLYGASYDYADFRAHAFAKYMDSKNLRRLETSLIHRYQSRLNTTYVR